MNTTAFTNGTQTWQELDRTIDEVDGCIGSTLRGMAREEKLYILGALADAVSNREYDLAEKSYTDRVLPFPLMEPPTPMECDHCGKPVHCSPEPINGEIGSFQHLDGYYGCMNGGNSATVNGQQCLHREED